ncbi:MAG: phosphoribosylanthranilate isomerase [Eubacteriales bacterium]|nr:phosphoribosylanthranilate isomerase [Eubacteriales bacterium]
MNTRIKLCGLSRECDIEAVNILKPDYIGFVFAKKSIRYVSEQQAAHLKSLADSSIRTVGVFVDADVREAARLMNSGVIDIAQLHGHEDEVYIDKLRQLTTGPVIQAFGIRTEEDVLRAACSTADYILLDSGSGGTGTAFDWSVLENIGRPYFLAGGLDPENVSEAVGRLHPFAVDVSSGIETDGSKDIRKMSDFCAAVRKAQSGHGSFDESYLPLRCGLHDQIKAQSSVSQKA